MTSTLLTVSLTLLIVLPQFGCAQSNDRTMYVCMYRAPQSVPGSKATPTFQGLAVSTDRGYSWYNRGWQTSTSNSLVRHAGKKELLFLANDYGILRSEDNGISWKLVTNWSFPTPLSMTFADERLWAGTAEGPYYSDDHGESWNFAGTQLPKLDARYIAQIIATQSAGPDSGNDFSDNKETDTGSSESDRHSALYVATANGIWKSSNNGRDWHPFALRGQSIDRMALHPDRPALMAALNGSGGFWLSTDAGTTWSDRSAGMASRILQCLAFDPRSGGSLLVGTRDMGLLKTMDLGSNWNIASGGLSNFYITSVTYDPDLDGVVFAGTDSGIFVSEDSGDTWQTFSIRKGHVSEIRIY